MASKTAIVKALVLGDTDNFQRGMKDAGDATENLDKRSGGSFKRIAESAAGFLTAQAIPAVAGFGRDLIELGGTVDTWEKKAQTVFGDQTGMMTEWADSVNESMGASDEEVLNMATSLADLLKPLGFTAEQAGNMSKEMLDLSGALSAWSGGTKTAADVSDVLSDAMLGETDGLKALGISISAAEIESKALSMGLVENEVDMLKVQSSALSLEKAEGKLAKAIATYGADSEEARIATSELELAQAKYNGVLEGAPGEVDDQSKAIATQALILEKSTDAQAAWSDGTMDSIKKGNDLKARFEDMKVALAEKLTPAFQTFVGWILSDGIPILEDTVALFREHVVPVLETVASFVVDDLVPAFKSIADWLIENEQVLIGVLAAIGVGALAVFVPWAIAAGAAALATLSALAPVILIGGAIAALVAGVIWAYQNWGWFREAVDAVAGFMKDVLWPIIKDVAAWLADNVPKAIGKAKDGLLLLKDKFVEFKDTVVDVKNWIVTKFDEVVDFFSGLPGRIRDVLGNLKDLLWDAGVGIISGLWDGAISRWNQMTGWLGSIGGKIKGLKGPIEADRVLLQAEGQAIMEGLGVGLEKGWKPVESFLSAASGAIKSAVADPTGGRSMIRWGEVSGDIWQQLMGQGWKGRAGDRMEAIYRPFAAGGLVKGGRGGVLGAIGEGRQDELVVPLDRSGRAAGLGTNIYVTVDVKPGANMRDAGRHLTRALNEFARAS